MKRKWILSLAFGLGFFTSASAKPFTETNKKAMVVFVASHSQNVDLRLNLSPANLKESVIGKPQKGITTVLGLGTVFDKADIKIESQGLYVGRKKVRPGDYIFINASAVNLDDFGKSFEFGCFDKTTKIISLKAGTITIVPIPDGRPLSDESTFNWATDPKLSKDELQKITDLFISENPNYTAPVNILDGLKASFPSKVKNKKSLCFPTKEKTFQLEQ